jgi:aminoglycoside phosphotransferase (APT) family kinase protein
MGRLLATGNVADVFEWNSRVIKLYKSSAAKPAAFREAAIHAAVEAMGLPVPRVWSVQHIGDRWGVVFDRVNHASFAEQMLGNADKLPRCLHSMVRLHMRIHAHSALQFADLKVRLAGNIAATELLDERRKRDLLDGISDMPDGDRLCHGDFHPLNILGEASQPVIIDWPDARRGDPAADLCRSYLVMKLHVTELARTYLHAYCRAANMSRQAVIGWLPYVAAARLAEDVPRERDELLKFVDRSGQRTVDEDL